MTSIFEGQPAQKQDVKLAKKTEDSLWMELHSGKLILAMQKWTNLGGCISYSEMGIFQPAMVSLPEGNLKPWWLETGSGFISFPRNSGWFSADFLT